MTGIIIAAIAGIILSLVDAGKKTLAAQFQPEVVILLMNSFGIVCNLLYFALVGFPPVDWQNILFPFGVCGVLGVFGEILILKALREADFSLTMPLMAFIPVFGALLGFLLFAEIPSFGAGIGVCLVVVGSYLLGIDPKGNWSWWDPLYQVFGNRGCQYMISFSLLCAAGCVGQRYGAHYSSPMFFFTMTLMVNWIVFLSIVLIRRTHFIRAVCSKSLLIIATGIFWALGVALMFLSYNLTFAAYAGSAMQLGTVVSIIVGALFFKEKAFRQRLMAGMLMVVGVAMVALLN